MWVGMCLEGEAPGSPEDIKNSCSFIKSVRDCSRPGEMCKYCRGDVAVMVSCMGPRDPRYVRADSCGMDWKALVKEGGADIKRSQDWNDMTPDLQALWTRLGWREERWNEMQRQPEVIRVVD